ncbi:MAG: transcription elongation factor GreA [Phototrophicales bacterium]
MAFDDDIILTRAGYEKLQRELNLLTQVEASEMAERMAEIRSEGDFAQDSAFFDAMTDKNMLDERIAFLQHILNRAQILEDDLDPDSATPGDRITVQDMDTGETFDFDLISGVELAYGKRRGVSLKSPVGQALLGKKVGDVVEVEVPDGKVRYKILSMSLIPDET